MEVVSGNVLYRRLGRNDMGGGGGDGVHVLFNVIALVCCFSMLHKISSWFF